MFIDYLVYCNRTASHAIRFDQGSRQILFLKKRYDLVVNEFALQIYVIDRIEHTPRVSFIRMKYKSGTILLFNCTS